ncbi:MAG: vitamin B12-dependent ribonucleotide reductase [Chloroflexi bacterium]|nr:vitamin B12-dependent ribonucleotide reductase [Chloroflexota bacterium]
MGITDRPFLEQIANQVIQKLKVSQPLPGMENLVPQAPPKKKKDTTPSYFEIESLIKEVLATKTEPGVQSPESGDGHSRLKTQDSRLTAQDSGLKTPLTPNAITVLERRYLIKDKEGKPVETPEDLLHRVARHIAAAELKYDPVANVAGWEQEFFEVMARLDFLPNSPTLMNAGRELGQLSACFVLPVEDTMESIFDAVKHTALIHKSGGGTGFSFSRLRPEKDTVGSTGGVASGPVSFIRAFDTATDVIKQGGMRRGANMAILNVDHPDIMKFITVKEDMTSLTNFNLSVAVNSTFMQAVIKSEDYNLVNPRNKQVVEKLNARQVFDKIVDLAWKTGDPGVIFLDRINRSNPTPHLGTIESTNPCGEQPLLPYESCNLGSINLALMVRDDGSRPALDWNKLNRTVVTAVRFLDDVIDVNQFPMPEIREKTLATRKVGLGIMGFADMLIQLGIPYDSEEALQLGGQVMRFIGEKATSASAELARERGVFPAFQGSIYDSAGCPRVRNATRTTIAPTGSLSIIAGCSSGIEPLFALSYTRHILDNDELVEVNPYFENVARKEGFYSRELIQELARGKRLRDMDGIPEHVKRVFVTAHDIAPEWHVRMQAAFQRHTDNAVSKTVNFPHDATREDVSRVYFLAYEEGLKGITIYRDGCRDKQVLTTGKSEAPKAAAGLVPRKRPKTTRGVTEKITTGCGNIYVTVNFDEEGICELFASLGKAGGCASAQLEATARLISMALRSGIDPVSIVKNLRGIRCPSIAWEEGHAVLSCADAIGSVLEKHCQAAGNPASEPTAIVQQSGGDKYDLPRNTAGQCPDCGSLLVFQEGCHKCPGCGYTKC